MSEKLGIITGVIDYETVKVKVFNSKEVKEIKGDKFYISELKEGYENDNEESEGIVIVKFDDDTNRLIEDFNEGDL